MRCHNPSRRLGIALLGPLIGGTVFLAAPAAGAAQAVQPIGPNQPFVGATHGPMGTDKILMICPGPANTGHPAGGQSVEVVERASTTGGFTGSKARKIVVSFPAASVTAEIVLHDYGVRVPIPTTLTLPCSGTGIVPFTPEPFANNARADLVTVTFEPGPEV